MPMRRHATTASSQMKTNDVALPATPSTNWGSNIAVIWLAFEAPRIVPGQTSVAGVAAMTTSVIHTAVMVPNDGPIGGLPDLRRATKHEVPGGGKGGGYARRLRASGYALHDAFLRRYAFFSTGRVPGPRHRTRKTAAR